MSDESTIAELQIIFGYDPETGYLYRRAINTRWGIKPCKELRVGTVGSHGYLQVTHKRKYLVHRLIWALVNNNWPKVIDHINRDRKDNRLLNLRNCDQSVNTKNGPIRLNNKTGFIGVQKHQGRFMARCSSFYGTQYIGMYDTAEEAAAARQQYLEEHQNG